MKTTLTLLTICFFTAIFCSCGKDAVPVVLTKEEQVAKMLTGNGNKVWRLRAMKVNNADISLTSDQQKYTKTYTMVAPQTIMGTFTDSDGYIGDWNMQGAGAIYEEFSQIGGAGFGVRPYKIITITDTELRMSYVGPVTMMKIEELYHAY